jgi:hypothetical protein
MERAESGPVADGQNGDEGAYIYDQVYYPSYVHQVADPDLLCAAGQFYGWQGPDPATATILEIGCCDGLNLISLAAEYPGARCLGFDLSAAAIEQGRELVAAAGLTNVRLEHADILTFPREGEQFDYILCHGVLSWVPQEVRGAIFEVIGGRLAPGGAAYVGYDALPAAAIKPLIVDFLLRHVDGIGNVPEQVQAAIEIIDTLARNQHPRSRLRPQLDDVVENHPNFSPAYFLHDWLVPAYAPLSVRDFAAAASVCGLAFAGDISLSDLLSADIDAAGQALLRASMGSLVSFAADLDLLRGSRMYRTDLLVRADAPPPGLSRPPFLTYCYTEERTEGVDAEGRRTVTLSMPRRGSITLVEPQQIAVADWIADRSPDEVSVDEVAAGSGVGRAEVEALLRRFAMMGILDIHSTPQPFTLSPGERPLAGRLARAMASGDGTLASLRHCSVWVEEPMRRAILQLSDGTRTRAGIARALTEGGDRPVSVAEVDARITALAKLRLFAA